MATKADTVKLVKSINEALPEKRLSEAVLDKLFESFWTELEAKLDTIRRQRATTAINAPPQRTQMEIAQETLELIRSLIPRQGQVEAWVEAIFAKLFSTNPMSLNVPGAHTGPPAATGGTSVGGTSDTTTASQPKKVGVRRARQDD